MTYIGPRAFAIAFGVVCGVFFATFVILDRVATTFESAPALSDAPGTAPARPGPDASPASNPYPPAVPATPARARIIATPAVAPKRAASPVPVAPKPAASSTAVALKPVAPSASVAPTRAASSAAALPPAPHFVPSAVRPTLVAARAAAPHSIRRPAQARVPHAVSRELGRAGRPRSPRAGDAPSSQLDRRESGILVPVGRGSLSNDGSATGEAILVPVTAPRTPTKPES